ncbi:MAG: hypothetical protein J6S28_06165 [Clostridia bacterium]|nr:hypothetical protein [Clostridia bacterium]
MYLRYLIIASIFFFTIKGIIQSIKSKKTFNLLVCLLFIPFQFFFFITLLFGGSALNNAETEYELYQAGHYYLESHGQWTEVSHGKYVVALISEIVGISTFIIAFVMSLIRVFTNNE